MSTTGGFPFSEPCPYLPDRESTIEVYPGIFSPELYELLLPQGWRRSGSNFYRYRCNGCSLCIPIRLSSTTLRLTGRLKRILQRNADLKVRLFYPEYKEEYFILYEKYCKNRHNSNGISDETAFQSLFTYVSSAMVEYRSAGDKLEGLGFLDILPNGFSSVYFIFDPDSSDRSLGHYSVLKEASLALEYERKWYYLGFWIPGSKKMDYKADYKPLQIAPQPCGNWVDVSDRNHARLYLEQQDA